MSFLSPSALLPCPLCQSPVQRLPLDPMRTHLMTFHKVTRPQSADLLISDAVVKVRAMERQVAARAAAGPQEQPRPRAKVPKSSSHTSPYLAMTTGRMTLPFGSPANDEDGTVTVAAKAKADPYPDAGLRRIQRLKMTCRRFSCPSCDYSCSTTQMAREHVRTKHPDFSHPFNPETRTQEMCVLLKQLPPKVLAYARLLQQDDPNAMDSDLATEIELDNAEDDNNDGGDGGGGPSSVWNWRGTGRSPKKPSPVANHNPRKRPKPKPKSRRPEAEAPAAPPPDFRPGDVVWARLTGYPWWPGVVLREPFPNGEFYKLDEGGRYHVLFFDRENQMTRAWIRRLNVERFDSREQKPFPKEKKYRPGMMAALQWTDRCFDWDRTMRVERFVPHMRR